VAAKLEDIMVADISDNGPGHEALLEAIARQAARAPRQQLMALFALATFGSVAAALTAPHGLSLAMAGSALCAAAALLTLWELCRRSTIVTVRVRAGIQKILAILGVLFWFLGGMALLLALLGDPWQL
jgi:hypothetical protein